MKAVKRAADDLIKDPKGTWELFQELKVGIFLFLSISTNIFIAFNENNSRFFTIR